MSDTDLEEIPLANWLDSESDFPEISSVNSTPNSGVNVISPSADIHLQQALGIEDSNSTGAASNKGNPVGHVLLEETGSDKGVNLLETPIHTPPQSKSPSSLSCHHPVFRVGPWVQEEGRDEWGQKSVQYKHIIIDTHSEFR